MKKVVSVFLAVIMLFSAFTSYGAERRFAGDVLADIQTRSGFVPNKTSYVTGNCYAFVSAVCERLYGVKYQEGLNGNGYTCRHETGLFYAVSIYKTTSTNTAECVNDIINFFVNNGRPGDIVHYSNLSGSTHTFMINSIDKNKMSIYHSNYQTRNVGSETCHIDNIYWDSFRKNPTQTIYASDGSLYSHNAIFYNKQKRGGLGISINRYKDYDKLYYSSFPPPTLSVENTGTTQMKLSWTGVEGAQRYCVQYKKSSDSNYSTLSSTCTSLNYVVSGLEKGAKYDFRVCAFASGKWRDYSDVVRKQALPPAIKYVRFIPEGTGLRIKWAKRDDVDGVKLYKYSQTERTYKHIKTFKASANHYVDTSVKYGVKYYYKLERYITVGKNTYGANSKYFEGCYILKTPDITYSRKDKKTIVFTFNGDGYQESFDYSVTTGKGKTSGATVNTTDKTLLLEDLTVGETYNISVREKTAYATGEYGKLSVVAAPRPVTGVTAQLKRRGVRIYYDTQSDADGYYIYRSDGKEYNKIATINNKNTATYFDNTVKYNTPCKYLVKAYALSDAGKEVEGDAGTPSETVNMVLAAPANIKVTRLSPTKMKISWNAAKYAGKYDVVYRAKGGKWITVSNIKGKSCTVKKLAVGTKYYFRVRSKNSFGCSAYSSAVKRKALPPAPEAPAVRDASNGLKVVYKPKKYAMAYEIYRSNSSSGKFKYIATVSGHKKNSYIDKDAPGSRCRYKLVCVMKKRGTVYKSTKSAAGSLYSNN